MPPDTSGNICAIFTKYNKKEDAFITSSFSFLPLFQRLTNHYYKQMHTQLELEHQASLKHVEIRIILEFVTVKTIVSVTQHNLGKLVERVVHT